MAEKNNKTSVALVYATSEVVGMFTRALPRSRFAVETCVDVAELMRRCVAGFLPDLLVFGRLDAEAADWELVRFIRSREFSRLGSVPLLALMPGLCHGEYSRMAHEAGVNAQLVPPVGDEQLLDQVDRLLADLPGRSLEEWGGGYGIAADDRVVRELRERLVEARREGTRAAGLVDALPLPIYLKSADGRHVSCNRAFTDFTGLRPEDIRGKLPTDLWPIELSNVYRWNDIAHLAGVKPGNYVHKMPHRSGEMRDVLFVKDVFFDEAGKVAGIVGAFMDLSGVLHCGEKKDA